ncbi:MAG: hypothetical protein IV090_09375 [Candidatus Sericytochromatia bacterium]|nr:hypothetical protein [Candidatus Sericytochromatia bacterium]
MTSIFSGQLYHNFLKDNNQYRLETYDVNRFQRTIEQMSNQGLAEKELREGLEYQQAKMADMQSKLNELIEKLNNVYRQFVENKTMFRKVSQEPKYYGSSSILNGLPNVDNPSGLPGVYPTGPDGILPFDDPGRIRNYSYNPFFGSKATDESDKTLNRTFWEEPNQILEQAYTENGAFWSSIAYLWGWDLDRINATYATTSNNNTLQVNVTALQPNKPQYPPLRPGDRFPLNWLNGPGGAPADYPAINLRGLRPGGVDYSHATDSIGTGGDDVTYTANIIGPPGNGSPGNGFFVDNSSFLAVGDAIVIGGTTGLANRQITAIIPAPLPGLPNRAEIVTNGWNPYGSPIDVGTISKTVPSSTAHMNVAGQNSVNWGWEFDDLPLSLEVTSVSAQPDGNTVPTGYRVVYDIPPTHPFYEDLKVLNGTEPQIKDAPTEMVKERLNNAGFDYTGSAYFPGSNVVGFQVGPLFRTSRGAWVVSQPGENEYSAPGVYTPADGPIAAFDLYTCLPGSALTENTRVSFRYRYRVHQNSAQFGSTWDDSGPGVPSRFGFSRHDWSSNPAQPDVYGGGNTYGTPMPATYRTVTNEAIRTAGGVPISLSLGTAKNPNTFGSDYLQTSGFEELFAQVVPVPGQPDAVRVQFLFQGDLNSLEIEVTDFQIVTYDGDLNTWEQGKYNSGNVDPVIWEGDPAFTQADSPYEVISKYVPNTYQFTQFNDQYTNAFSVSDRNDIVRSPWEFGQLNIDSGSGLSGEMWLDLNGRRLNLDHDAVVDQVTLWDGTVAAPVNSNTDILQSAAVAKAYAFIDVEHPEDDCGPNPEMEVEAGSGPGNPFDPSAPTGGIRVDSVAGFTIGDQILIGGAGPYTIVGLVNDAGSPAAVSTDPVFDDPAIPTYEYRPPFDGLPPGDRLGTSLPVDPVADFPLTIGAITYNTYADLAAAFTPPAWHPHAGDPMNPLYWAEYTQSSSPAVPARQEVYINVPIAPPAAGVLITLFNATPVPPHEAQFADSDPLSNFAQRAVLMGDEVLLGEAARNPATTGIAPRDPGRTANPTAGDPNNNGFTWADADFYANFGVSTEHAPFPGEAFTVGNPSQFITGTENDRGITTNPDTAAAGINGTVDRVMGSDLNIEYRVSIPTNDVNVLRKENNLLFNFGSIDERDWSIDIRNPYMEFRTAGGYTTVPRYRVDAGGNIFDAFGKGAFEDDTSRTQYSAQDALSVQRVYTTAGGATLNNQVSNADKGYDMSNYAAYNNGAADFEDYITSHNRLSMNGDDYNLFDYVPDLNLIPGDSEGRRFGELYVGSLPSNFYYYRENLDNGAVGTGAPYTVDRELNAALQRFNNDGMGTLNFNGRAQNLLGHYDAAETTVVHNPNMPAWSGVVLGVAEQDAKLRNAQRTTTSAFWRGFSGADVPLDYSRNVILGQTSNVTGPERAVGASNSVYATMEAGGSQITLQMPNQVNRAGHLIINEWANGAAQPHAIPLPLFDVGSFPLNTPTSYTFASYGPQTVTRTGGKYLANFQTELLDGVDGLRDGNINAALAGTLLTSAGGVVSTTHPPATWGAGLILHVDDANAFDVEGPRNEVYLGTDTTTRYRVVQKNANTYPQTLFLLPVSGTVPAAYQNNVHTDLQIRQIVGEYTVSVVDAAGTPSSTGDHVRINYNDLGTQTPGNLVSVALSAEMDRVGRVALGDPRTPGADLDNPLTPTVDESQRIAPEVFPSPQGYVQADAQVSLNLVSQDIDGNLRPRKLRSVRVEIESGEQLIPNKVAQSYSTTGPFAINGEWPIAIYEGETQLNPYVTSDLDILVGHYQGITNGANATNTINPSIDVTATDGFSVGEEISVNGERRRIAGITGNTVQLDSPLSNAPLRGDRLNLGNGLGTRELSLFLNKTYAMAAGAPVRVHLEYDEYDVVGFPPRVDTTAPVRTSTESIGFGDPDPSQRMEISGFNTGDGSAGNPLQVVDSTGFNPGDVVNINSLTRRIATIVGNDLTFDQPVTTALGQIVDIGTIYRSNYEDFLQVGPGRSGGSFENDFTKELKRILDNPEYQDILRYGLMENLFISASSNDPFNNIISSKLYLNWMRTKRQLEITQTSFMAYFKSA